MYGVAFTPDGHGLVSSSWDETLKYWDISHLANGHRGRPNSREEDVGTREGNRACTMDFIGHKVRVKFADRGCV